MKDSSKELRNPAPQKSFTYMVVSRIARWQLRYLAQHIHNANQLKTIVIGFVMVEGIIAIGTIAAVAHVIDFPLLFPPLGPSAFILFFLPMAERSSPRNCIMGHGCGLVAGLIALHLVIFLFPDSGLALGVNTSWFQVFVICLAMGFVCSSMIGLNCIHPPAAATALMGAMGYLDSWPHVIGIISAVLLLVFEAIIFNRLLGGLPYPLWGPNEKILKKYGSLAGLPTEHSSALTQFVDKLFDKRMSDDEK